MNNKIIQSVVFLLILSACSSNQVADTNSEEVLSDGTIVAETTQTDTGECQIKKVHKTIEGNSMSPMLKNGGEINLLEDYYKCGKSVEKGDLVAYHYGGDKRPLIKIVKVTSEDTIEIVGTKMHVNDEELVNSVGSAYTFSKPEINMLNLYIREGHIPTNTFFLFGDNVSVSTDSRKFGAVSPTDFLGKFEIIQKED